MRSTPIYPPHFFRRDDESDDRLFYKEPRLVVHIDDAAITAIRRYFVKNLPRSGVILDLMSSWRSHMPDDLGTARLTGMGLNSTEMRENPQLSEYAVHDLNACPALPFADGVFDAAVVTVSIQYMTRPAEVFEDVWRVLAKGGRFHVIYSNRMFPTKAIAVWRALDDRWRGQLVASYFTSGGRWEDITILNISPSGPAYSDPVYVVSGRKTVDVLQ